MKEQELYSGCHPPDALNGPDVSSQEQNTLPGSQEVASSRPHHHRHNRSEVLSARVRQRLEQLSHEGRIPDFWRAIEGELSEGELNFVARVENRLTREMAEELGIELAPEEWDEDV